MITMLCVVASAVLLGVGLATGVIVLSYAALAVALLGIAVWLYTYIRERPSNAGQERPASSEEETEQAAKFVATSDDENNADVEEPAEEADEAVTPDEVPAPGETADSAEHAAAIEQANPGDAPVVVVPGRKRYHHTDCANLNGHAHEQLTLDEARDEGFTACTTCAS